MIRLRFLLLYAAILCSAACASPPPPGLTAEGLVAQIEQIAGEVETAPNVVQFQYEGRVVVCVYDETHDRMRFVAPVIDGAKLDPRQLEIMLTANYHTTLDARYAMSEGTVSAVFLHPLSTLSPELLASAIHQVASLAKNFGTSYSSDVLIFGGPQGEEI